MRAFLRIQLAGEDKSLYSQLYDFADDGEGAREQMKKVFSRSGTGGYVAFGTPDGGWIVVPRSRVAAVEMIPAPKAEMF